MMKRVDIFVGVHCRTNPGAGGWCGIVIWRKHRKVMSGREEKATNMRMYLRGAVEGILALKEACDVRVYCRSEYPEGAIGGGWRIRKNREVLAGLYGSKHNHEIAFVSGAMCGNQANLDIANKIAEEEVKRNGKTEFRKGGKEW